MTCSTMPVLVTTPAIAVIIPAYRVCRHLLDVVAGLPPLVTRIYIVDDCCPEGSGRHVEEQCTDTRVRVLYNATNLGVGGAVMAGYERAVRDGCTVLVKVDGDGQMDPALLPRFVGPILRGEADYTKGNRFYDLANIGRMPAARLAGNAALSFLTKLSTGYWDIFDPTNGYTAIHADVARRLPFAKISQRYFFETDMLFRLGTFRAVVADVPMDAFYGDEVSNLKISKIVGEFALKHARNFLKRVFYSYFLRDMAVASLQLVAGLALMGFGTLFGATQWLRAYHGGQVTSAGTVMLAALPVLVGLQFLLAFLGYDIASVPRRPIHGRPLPAYPSAPHGADHDHEARSQP